MNNIKYKICNVVLDEKFIDGAIEGMDLFSDRWEMQWVVCQNSGQELKRIKKYSNRITQISENRILDFFQCNNFDAVILHNFAVIPPSIILKIPKKIKVFWFGWGYDIYNFPADKPFLKWNLYKPLTTKYINSSFDIRMNLLKMKIKDWLKGHGNSYSKALSRIDYFSGVVDFEYDLLKLNPNFRAQQVSFSYSDISFLHSFDCYEDYNGKNILVGNSAMPTNNHLDLIEYLKRVDLTDRKIILPLSYAGPKNYVKEVEKSYRAAFDNMVIALTSFMPFDEYLQYVQSCNTAIFFMERQQAMGNITASMKYGSKVFLSEKNPVYRYYKDLGLSIFSVEQDFNNENLTIPLSDFEINQNRSILKKMSDYNAYIAKLETIYNALRS